MQIWTKADWRTEGVDKDWMKNLIINKLSTCWIAPRCSQCNALKLSSPNWKWINHLQTVASLALCSSCWCCTSDRSVTPAKGRERVEGHSTICVSYSLLSIFIGDWIQWSINLPGPAARLPVYTATFSSFNWHQIFDYWRCRSVCPPSYVLVRTGICLSLCKKMMAAI